MCHLHCWWGISRGHVFTQVLTCHQMCNFFGRVPSQPLAVWGRGSLFLEPSHSKGHKEILFLILQLLAFPWFGGSSGEAPPCRPLKSGESPHSSFPLKTTEEGWPTGPVYPDSPNINLKVPYLGTPCSPGQTLTVVGVTPKPSCWAQTQSVM